MGKWFGPTTAAQVLQRLVTRNAALHGDRLAVHVAQDAALNAGQISQQKQVLVLVPVTLALNAPVEADYLAGLRACFCLPQFVGVVGGKPRKSLYFVGSHGDDRLLYLDPHQLVQPASPRGQTRDTGVRTLGLSELDPSMLLGFLCTGPQDVDLLRSTTDRLFASVPLYKLLFWK